MTTAAGGDAPSPKTLLRRRLLAARRERAPEHADDGAAIRDAALAWPSLRAARRVALYAAIGTEPDTRPLLEALHRAGVEVLLPVVLPDLDLDWAAYDPPAMQTARGLDEPGGARLGVDAVRTADVVLVPGLAVSARGERLGRGGGCYDRALARVGDVPVVVVLYPEEVGVDVPVEPHDRPVTHVLTADGVSEISRPA